jgi:transposase InsO family protein
MMNTLTATPRTRRAYDHRLREQVEATLLSACLDRVLAQVDVAFSNSMIEAFWRSLKHQWLYLNSLDSIERLRAFVEFYVEQHNTQMPHAAFHGQTPDEMYFGTAANLPAELAAAREQAPVARLAQIPP